LKKWSNRRIETVRHNPRQRATRRTENAPGSGNPLEQYETANGIYPKTLDVLVPTYIRAIPDPKSAEWVYLPDSAGNEFGLFF
jgi:hypothetical protein